MRTAPVLLGLLALGGLAMADPPMPGPAPVPPPGPTAARPPVAPPPPDPSPLWSAADVATLEEIQTLLGPMEALVLYQVGRSEAHALVVTAAKSRIVTLGSVADLEAACAALAMDAQTSDVDRAIPALRRKVVDPLGLGVEIRRVLVSPSGVLATISFALLLGDREVAYVPSATTYARLRKESHPGGEGILALGDPDYEARAEDPAFPPAAGSRRLMRVPGTREEAMSVGTEVLLGREATEAGLAVGLAKRPRWRAVHFACQSIFDPERPALSSLALTPRGDDDGLLTATEVLRTKIRADLVVLAASDTARGRYVPGEGVVGLTRAFMSAGAPRVIGSLWKVDDQATRALMSRFYELWSPRDGTPGLPAATALRQAQQFVAAQEKWKHPRYWAAWALFGLPE